MVGSGGCLLPDHEQVVSLAELDGARLTIVTNASATEVTIRIADHANIGGRDCSVLEDGVKATLDGRELTVVSRGAWREPASTSAAASCELPTFRAAELPTAEADAAQELVISDDITTLRVSAIGVTAVRSFQLVGPLQRGVSTVATWSVATDEREVRGGIVVSPVVHWMPQAGPAARVDTQSGQISYAAGTLTFTLPASAMPGPGELQFAPFLGPRVTTCDGFDTCVSESVRVNPIATTLAE